MSTPDAEQVRLRAIAAADETVARLTELPDTGELPRGPLPYRSGGITHQAPRSEPDPALDEWISSVQVPPRTSH